ncbi:MAG: hypothetical protein EOO88_52655 [Pedobacter sp.]|nr:MAG: hypothetical protein EOO88_52655 [Pedobacter sp.]
MRILLFATLILFAACNNTTDTKVAPADNQAVDSATHSTLENTEPIQTTADTVPQNLQIDTVINLAFAPDNAILTARGTINKKSDPVSCYLQVAKPMKISGTIIPDDPQLNVRFSQVFMPDNSSDGPFTRQLKYDFKKAGLYRIIIAPNNMAEGKRSGDFTLKLEAK